ncbi:MAG: solute-binding protein [Rhodospirillaceae bacterium]|jgi:tungstate transport system substrate-binding protein|nr:solute-binding protein [Rhodospirillaceae bacterium]MBT4701141.1 solute-binding protein [Rhodospirillaceae bacterium]MBT5033718.1 solute-binding protein [Rhodospirillaceae bacterium]MBT6221898.1 solute-binding protein [Rhodospirillaceae bacterium]MBT8003603.1 solute-binding protein [Rhodospirillales bacterium]
MGTQSGDAVVKAIAIVIALGIWLAAGLPAQSAEKYITLTSTTSTENSGLLRHILPMFSKKTGILVRVVAVGTGQAIRIARRGDADVLLVHHRTSEEKFVADGFGIKRYDVMYNDFIIVGPTADPAKIHKMKNLTAALLRISATKSPFMSRGDDSGTHKRELSLWMKTGVNLKKVSGTWYRETGSGMGATLNTSSATNAYTMTDRGTWLAFQNKVGLSVLVEGLPPLFNPYGVILVNKAKHPHVKAKEGQILIDWLISKEGQKAIGAFTINGKKLFTPNAKPGQ